MHVNAPRAGVVAPGEPPRRQAHAGRAKERPPPGAVPRGADEARADRPADGVAQDQPLDVPAGGHGREHEADEAAVGAGVAATLAGNDVDGPAAVQPQVHGRDDGGDEAADRRPAPQQCDQLGVGRRHAAGARRSVEPDAQAAAAAVGHEQAVVAGLGGRFDGLDRLAGTRLVRDQRSGHPRQARAPRRSRSRGEPAAGHGPAAGVIGRERPHRLRARHRHGQHPHARGVREGQRTRPRGDASAAAEHRHDAGDARGGGAVDKGRCRPQPGSTSTAMRMRSTVGSSKHDDVPPLRLAA